MVCDFKTVFGIFHSQVKQSKLKAKTNLFHAIFNSYSDERFPYEYYRPDVSNWTNGVKPILNVFVDYYLRHKSNLKSDITKIVDNFVFDKNAMVINYQNLIADDKTLSDEIKQNILSISDDMEFITEVILLSMSRPHDVDVNAIVSQSDSEKYSLLLKSYFGDCDPPEACEHFCGRDNELNEVHELMNKHRHIFIQGIGGIGKSEFVKSYAEKYKEEYNNILYFTYHGSLAYMISNMEGYEGSSKQVFKDSNRLLRSMKEDTLLIIDNFNTTETEDEMLPVILKYKCRILFTTRCIFDCGYTYELGEIQDENTLIELFSKFYSDTENNLDTVKEIIGIIHSHTYAVELIARLLESGMLSPEKVLKKLKESGVNSTLRDKIKATKDNVSSKNTYYNHIQMLYDLLDLDDNMKYVLRCSTFIAVEGIPNKSFAQWTALPDMNTVNDLVELGLLKISKKNILSVHPMICDIIREELTPSIENCVTYLKNMYDTCLIRNLSENDKELYKLLINTCDNITYEKMFDYLHFLEEVFSYFETYDYFDGMKRIENLYSSALKKNASKEKMYLSKLYWMQSGCYMKADVNYSKALTAAEKALDYADSWGLEFKANCLHNVGHIYYYQKKYLKARDYYTAALELLQSIGKKISDVYIIRKHLNDVNKIIMSEKG